MRKTAIWAASIVVCGWVGGFLLGAAWAVVMGYWPVGR